jgi:hypothetical protein
LILRNAALEQTSTYRAVISFDSMTDLFFWPAPGSEDTELGVLMELEVRHGEAEVHA